MLPDWHGVWRHYRETADKYKGCDKRVTQHGHLAGSFSLGSGLRDRGLVQVYCKVLLEEVEDKAW